MTDGSLDEFVLLIRLSSQIRAIEMMILSFNDKYPPLEKGLEGLSVLEESVRSRIHEIAKIAESF